MNALDCTAPPLTITRAITIRRPWTWAILHAGKRVENRDWSTSYRGWLFLHAATKVARPLSRESARAIAADLGIQMPDIDTMASGALIAAAELVDCTRKVPRGQERWADPDAYYFILANIRPLPQPVPMRGALGIWKLSPTGLFTGKNVRTVGRNAL